MNRAKKKGFTLVELIIVIAIIGVLAAVLIPTFAGVVEKANLASDQAEVKNMNTVLSLEAVMQDKAYFSMATDVVALLKEEGFGLVPKAKGYAYWYDRATNKIVLASNDAVFSEKLSASSGMVAYADGEEKTFKQDSLEAVSSYNPNLLYVDQNMSNGITKMLNTIYNLISDAKEDLGVEAQDYTKVTAKMTALFEEAVANATLSMPNTSADLTRAHNWLKAYHPTTAIYVDNDDMYIAGGVRVNYEVIGYVFEPGITEIAQPSQLWDANVEISNNTLIIPSTVTKIGNGAFTGISEETVVTIENTSLLNSNNINPAAHVGSVAGAEAETVSATIVYQQAENKWSVVDKDYMFIYDRGVPTLTGTTNSITTMTGKVPTYSSIADLSGLNFRYTGAATVGGYTLNKKVATYLIPTAKVAVSDSKLNGQDIEINDSNGTVKLDGADLGEMRLMSRKYGNLVVFSGAVATKDGEKIYRIKSFGYFTQIDVNVFQMQSATDGNYQMYFRDPLQGMSLAGMDGITYSVTVTVNDVAKVYEFNSEKLNTTGAMAGYYVISSSDFNASTKGSITKIQAKIGSNVIFEQIL